jgi:threonine aldolase
MAADTITGVFSTSTRPCCISPELKQLYPVPTKEMFAYAVRASLGDDVYSDPSTIALEAHIAKLTGKEAALFVSSGTMGNQLAIRSHLQQPPHSIVCDVRAHINKFWLLLSFP